MYDFNYVHGEFMPNRWSWPEEHCRPQNVEILREMIRKYPEHFQFKPLTK